MFNEAYFVKEELPPPYRQACLLRRAQFEMAMHAHPFWQLIAVTDGQLTVCTANDQTTLHSGMVHILPPNCPHSLQSNRYAQFGTDLYTADTTRELVPLLNRSFSDPAVLQVPQILTLCNSIAEKQRIGTPLALAQMITLLDTFVFSCVEAAEQTRQHRFDTLLETFLDAHLADTLRLPDIAAQFYLSIPQVERLCRTAFGCGVMALLQQRRVHRAQLLLLSSELPIAEIGRLVGYPAPAHFSGFFRRVTGISPRAFRAQRNRFA